MNTRKLRTYLATSEQVQQDWYHVDATDHVLGRLAVRIATVLMGKHKPTYTPHVDTGDFVVVTNAEKIRLTGNKANTMKYAKYTYYVGGYSEIPFGTVFDRHPDRVITEAVRRMLPKSAMGRRMLKKLKVYPKDQHDHAAQQPKPLSECISIDK